MVIPLPFPLPRIIRHPCTKNALSWIIYQYRRLLSKDLWTVLIIILEISAKTQSEQEWDFSLVFFWNICRLLVDLPKSEKLRLINHCTCFPLKKGLYYIKRDFLSYVILWAEHHIEKIITNFQNCLNWVSFINHGDRFLDIYDPPSPLCGPFTKIRLM